MSVPGGIYSIIRGLLLLTALYRINIFREDLGLTRGIAVAAFAGLGLFYFISRGDVFVLDAALLTAGACQVSFKRIGMIYLFAGSFISLLALVCSQTGIIIDYTFLTNYGADERIRHSLGIIYPTDCYAHVFYLVAVYCILRWKRIRLMRKRSSTRAGFRAMKKKPEMSRRVR